MKKSLTRRSFIQLSANTVTTAAVLNRFIFAAQKDRRMTIDLVCGAIGVKADQKKAIQLARKHNFESVQPHTGELARMSEGQIAEILDHLGDSGLVWGASGLPVDFRKDEQTFREGLAKLRQACPKLQIAQVSRMSTWIMPRHDQLTYIQNFKQHADRLRKIGQVLADAGIRFGLEYVGPKTSWASSRFPFIHTMAETKDLLDEIGLENVGFVLDSWHWYTAGETRKDLLSLENQQIVAVDLNDAPAGIPVDEQMDLTRRLPMATGVIDLKSFLTALVDIGYDGPVRAEPFDSSLNRLGAEDAVKKTSEAMHKAFALLGET